ncbi:acyltransferase family protein [Herbaspirillum huttiense]|uniref:Acyltransferase n=2 Tax=Herbaspirillum huttiense TaxID=863372 RepID=A0AAJ2HGA7_9BURK|nr:acyltransferase [Herbaspirillum huttiense]MDR9839470.1 acyltransferase [Herbaspirillum huttiense]
MGIASNVRNENSFDALRLIAALFVFHSHQWVLSGREAEHIPWFDTSISTIGVTMFFAISGYLVTKSAMRNPNILSFYWNRIVRIMPGLTANVLFLFLIGASVTTLSFAEFWSSPVTREFVYKNILLAFNDPRYMLPEVFSGNPEHGLNGSLWTLPYEIAMYIGVGFALCATRERQTRVTIAIMALVTFFSILVLKSQVKSYSFPFELWNVFLLEQFGITGFVFTLGVLIALSDNLKHVLWMSLVASIILSFGDAHQAAPYALLPAVVILIGTSQYLKLPKALGDCSYGLYLYGFPVQQMLVHFIGTEHYALRYAIGLCMTFVLAFISWKVIEDPAIRFLKWRPTKSTATEERSSLNRTSS